MPATAHSERLTRAHRISRRHDASPTKPLARHALTSWVRGGASWVMKREARACATCSIVEDDPASESVPSKLSIKPSCPPGAQPHRSKNLHGTHVGAAPRRFNKTASLSTLTSRYQPPTESDSR